MSIYNSSERGKLCLMDQFKEGEQVHILAKWRDPSGDVNPRGEVAAILALTCVVAADGKTATMIHDSEVYTLPLIEGFAFRDPKEAAEQAGQYASQYYQADLPDPFAGQPILQ